MAPSRNMPRCVGVWPEARNECKAVRMWGRKWRCTRAKILIKTFYTRSASQPINHSISRVTNNRRQFPVEAKVCSVGPGNVRGCFRKPSRSGDWEVEEAMNDVRRATRRSRSRLGCPSSPPVLGAVAMTERRARPVSTGGGGKKFPPNY